MGGEEAKGDPGGILCPVCFIIRAEEVGYRPTAWELRPEGENPTISAEALLKNICDFVARWRGHIPKRTSPKSLNIISDFYLCMGAEAKIQMNQSKVGEP